MCLNAAEWFPCSCSSVILESSSPVFGFPIAGSSPKTETKIEVAVETSDSASVDADTDGTEPNNLASGESWTGVSVSCPRNSLNALSARTMECPTETYVGHSGSTVRFAGPVGVSPRSTVDYPGGVYDPFAYRDLGLHGSGTLTGVSQPLLGQPVAGGGLALEATPFPVGSESSSRAFDAFSDGAAGTSNNALRRYTSPDVNGRSSSSNMPESVAAVVRTPTFRRTPGARRPNVGSASRSYGFACPPLIPRPLFAPSITYNNYFCRIPSDFTLSADPRIIGRRVPPSAYWDQFQVVRTENRVIGSSISSSNGAVSNAICNGVELVVSNLDYNISLHEWKKILQTEFQTQVQVRFTVTAMRSFKNN